MVTICLYINATLLEVLININIPFGRQNVRLEVHTQKAAPGSKGQLWVPAKTTEGLLPPAAFRSFSFLYICIERWPVDSLVYAVKNQL